MLYSKMALAATVLPLAMTCPTCLLHIANPDGLKGVASLMGIWEQKEHRRVQLLVSRSPLRPAMLPRLIYPSRVGLEPAPSSAPIGHLARHHTQVICAALRRPASKNKAQLALVPSREKAPEGRTNIVRNILCAARFHIPGRTPICPD